MDKEFDMSQEMIEASDLFDMNLDDPQEATLEDQGWEYVASKDIYTEDGFRDVYYWYRKDGNNRFFFSSDVDYGDPDYFDWETDGEEAAQEWFDCYSEDDIDESYDGDIEEDWIEEESIDDIVDLFRVNGPRYRGEPYPTYSALSVNVQNFPDEMRPKYYNIQGLVDEIELTWEAQGSFNDADVEFFKKEIDRFFKQAIKTAHYEKPFTVRVEVTSRDGAEEGYADFELKYNEEKNEEPLKESNNTSEMPYDALSYEESQLADYLFEEYGDFYGTHGDYFRVDLPDMEELVSEVEDWDDRITKKEINKVVKALSPDAEVEVYDKYLQLSDEAVLGDIDVDIDDSDYDAFNTYYWEMVDEWLEKFDAENGVETHYEGRGGRHIVLDKNVENFINYPVLKDRFEKLQNEFIDYINNNGFDSNKNESLVEAFSKEEIEVLKKNPGHSIGKGKYKAVYNDKYYTNDNRELEGSFILSVRSGKYGWDTIEFKDSKDMNEFIRRKFKEYNESLKEHISDNMSAEDIAKKHNVSVEDIEAQVKKGIEVEKEHTDDEKRAERIALDHPFEIPDYYDRLNKMEKGALKEETDNKDKIKIEVIVTNDIEEDVVSGRAEYKYDEQTLEEWYDFASTVEGIVDRKFVVTNISLSKNPQSLSEYIDFYRKDAEGNKKDGLIDLRLSDHKSTSNARQNRKSKVSKLDKNYRLVSVIVNGNTFDSYESALNYVEDLLSRLDESKMVEKCGKKKLTMEEA